MCPPPRADIITAYRHQCKLPTIRTTAEAASIRRHYRLVTTLPSLSEDVADIDKHSQPICTPFDREVALKKRVEKRKRLEYSANERYTPEEIESFKTKRQIYEEGKMRKIDERVVRKKRRTDDQAMDKQRDDGDQVRKKWHGLSSIQYSTRRQQLCGYNVNRSLRYGTNAHLLWRGWYHVDLMIRCMVTDQVLHFL